MEGVCLTRGCCGGGARGALTERARAQLQASLGGELTKLAAVLDARANKFDESFRKLVAVSRAEFHAMFKRTYGMIYEQHSYVFEQLFEELQRYYNKGDLDFDQMMDGFFGILYQKMFTVLNSQYVFDERYLKCVNEHMRDIKPFEDVPSKLSVQLRRAFVATRTFRKALQAGAAAVRSMLQVGVTSECARAWARLRWCGACVAEGEAGSAGGAPPACSRYCHAELRACLAPHLALADQWDAYVDAIEKVADRLLGPFNIAMVVEPIDIKISEAIMSFQEHNQEISQKIFAGCGKPDLGGSGGAAPFFAPPERAPPPSRVQRAAPPFDWAAAGGGDDDFEIEESIEHLPEHASLAPDALRRATVDMAAQARARARFLQYMRGQIDLQQLEGAPAAERTRRDAQPAPAPAPAPVGELDLRLDYEGKRGAKKRKPSPSKSDYAHSAEWGGPAIDQLVRDTRARARSWRRYWARLPTALCLPVSVTQAPCFNGSAVAPYAGGVEPAPGAGGAGAVAAEGAREALRALTARLKDAYNGVEVQWRDADEPTPGEWARSAEGSGSGSGAGADEDAGGLPDDDEDRDYFPEGSGEREPDSIVPGGGGAPSGPSVVREPPTSNVHLRGRVLEPPPEQAPPAPPAAPPMPPAPPAGDAAAPTPTSAAAHPSLQRALFMYALPVVCAWFGAVVTELF